MKSVSQENYMIEKTKRIAARWPKFLLEETKKRGGNFSEKDIRELSTRLKRKIGLEMSHAWRRAKKQQAALVTEEDQLEINRPKRKFITLKKEINEDKIKEKKNVTKKELDPKLERLREKYSKTEVVLSDGTTQIWDFSHLATKEALRILESKGEKI